jgi:hypothetical protein
MLLDICSDMINIFQGFSHYSLNERSNLADRGILYYYKPLWFSVNQFPVIKLTYILLIYEE